jgi:Arc/MetJ-type ribon-helix-helix transcriptional regulator
LRKTVRIVYVVTMPKSKPAAPLTFDLPVSLITKIARTKRGHAFRSTSEVVRLALEQFDLGSFQPTREPHVQISVRIASKQRVDLAKAAKRKDASIGELIRAALEQLPEKPARAGKTRR